MSTGHMSERDLRLFLVFDALLTRESVTDAAEQLGVSQSAVSHSLRALRERFGDPLFVRSGNRMTPTPHASSLAPRLQIGLRELERLLTTGVEFHPATSRRRFSVATSDDMVFTLLPELTLRLRTVSPFADVRFDTVGGRTYDDLAGGHVDVVLARAEMESALRFGRDVKRTRVASERFLCLMRADHPAARRDLTIDTFLALPHVAVSMIGEVDPVDVALGNVGKRRVTATVATYPAATWFVEVSDMIATIPERIALVARHRRRIITRVPPLDLPSCDTCLWWTSHSHGDPGHRWWRETLGDSLRAFSVAKSRVFARKAFGTSKTPLGEPES